MNKAKAQKERAKEEAKLNKLTPEQRKAKEEAEAKLQDEFNALREAAGREAFTENN